MIYNIGSALEAHRVRAGYSISCVANALSISVDDYTDYELGFSVPTAAEMLFLVRFYGTTLDSIYGI